MTREQADELIDQALTGNPAAIKNLIAGEISAKMTWHDPNKGASDAPDAAGTSEVSTKSEARIGGRS